MTTNEPRGSRWSDLDRPPLNPTALRRALLGRPGDGGLWISLDVVDTIGSTHTELVSRAAAGTAGEGVALVAEEQTAGRGRLDRGWSAPARSGLFVSFVLSPPVPPERWGWLPLLTGVAAATSLARTAGTDVTLKWPNDLLVDVGGEERKLGGILAERVADDAVVVSLGLNVTLRASELPVPGAGSLALAGAAVTDRDTLLRAVLRGVEDWYGRWCTADADPSASELLPVYAAGCATLGRRVRVELPGGHALDGEAVAVDGDGRLVVADDGGVQRPVSAGDVVHVRPGDTPPG